MQDDLAKMSLDELKEVAREERIGAEAHGEGQR